MRAVYHDKHRFFYVGPVDPVGTEVVGPAGPTTANRMDGITDTMLGKSGLLAMVGKAERGPETVASIAKHRSANPASGYELIVHE